jgi:P4 family phage/plasmid primase-like protien
MRIVKSHHPLDNFLRENPSEKGTPFTHTRMGDPSKKIFPGSYRIPDDKSDVFIRNYYNKVFEKNESEFLTEKHLVDDGPVLIDIDLRYENTIESRQHTKEHIIDLVVAYCDKCCEIIDIPQDSSIEVFVMERESPCFEEQKTKDGVHIIISLQMHKALQVILRNKMLEEIKDIWSDLPITNQWDDVLDEGVTRGFSNWQMYGSQKPNYKPYKLTYFFNLLMEKDGWNLTDYPVSKFNLEKDFLKLSARNNKIPKFNMKDSVKEEFDKIAPNIHKKRSNANRNVIIKEHEATINYNQYLYSLRLGNAVKIDAKLLDEMIVEFLEEVETHEYKLKETHLYTMALPESYYGPGSEFKWIRVGWALANTDNKSSDNRLFLTWLAFSSREVCRETLQDSFGKFDWSNVQELFSTWQGFHKKNPDGLTNRSIMYWCKNDAKESYEKIHSETISHFIDYAIENPGEFNLATVLYHIFKDRFVCVSNTKNIWYEYYNYRWFENDGGNSLRLGISKEMYQLFFDMIGDLMKKRHQMDNNDVDKEDCGKKAAKLAEITQWLRQTQKKNNIMKEAKELFYDKDFMDKIDQNCELLCFNNCVVDFGKKTHRKGQPDDFITKCTNINYVPLAKIENKEKQTIHDIKEFMKQLFPDDELRNYMWEHLASVLIGKNRDHAFNIYNGKGANGKSVLVTLMAKALGDYKGTVPITLVTQKRNSIGSTSSEIVDLMGVRYAVMQEPTKGDKLNEGIMKEITGGDPIQGRALYKDSVVFRPQFKLVVCTNSLFDIGSNDDGTWRRIRVCEFKSKFLEKPGEDDEFPLDEYPHQFKVDKSLEDKFDKWAPVLMSMLVEKAFECDGKVSECQIVKKKSNEYREEKDFIARFIKEKVRKRTGDYIMKTSIKEEFKLWWKGEEIKSDRPNNDELYHALTKRFGAYKTKAPKGWQNVCLIEDEEADNDEEGFDCVHDNP